MMEAKPRSVRTNKSFPFYKAPSCLLKTSAEIISEARAAMASKTMTSVHSQQTIRTVNTKRPFTPRDTNRILFGSKKNNGRPPSAISIRQVHFHDLDSTALPKIGGISSIDQKPLALSAVGCVNMMKPQRWRLPAINDKRTHRKQLHQSSLSLENLPEESSESKQSDERDSDKDLLVGEVIKTEPSIEAVEDKSRIKDAILTSKEVEEKVLWSAKDFKTKGFPHSHGSPRKVVGMDKLMEWTEISDLADEENRINEARAAAPSILTSDVIILDEEEETVESAIEKLNALHERGGNSTQLISYT